MLLGVGAVTAAAGSFLMNYSCGKAIYRKPVRFFSNGHFSGKRAFAACLVGFSVCELFVVPARCKKGDRP